MSFDFDFFFSLIYYNSVTVKSFVLKSLKQTYLVLELLKSVNYFWQKLHVIYLTDTAQKNEVFRYAVRLSSVNVTKSAGNCGFGSIY